MSLAADTSPTSVVVNTLGVPADHPALAGHFPGQPIVPGVMLLDQALLALAQVHQLNLDRMEIAVAKFLSPVRPGDALSVTLTPSATSAQRWTLDISAGRGEQARPAASATVLMVQAAAGA